MAKPRTAKQKAALRKAQLASAKKRKRNALARNAGRGLIGSKKGSSKRKYRIARKVGGAVASAAVVGAMAYAHKRRSDKRWARAEANGRAKQRDLDRQIRRATRNGRGVPKVKHRKGYAMSKGPNRHNRIFVTNSYGKTSVRRRRT